MPNLINSDHNAIKIIKQHLMPLYNNLQREILSSIRASTINADLPQYNQRDIENYLKMQTFLHKLPKNNEILSNPNSQPFDDAYAVKSDGISRTNKNAFKQYLDL